MSEETSTVTDLAAELRGKLVDELCEWEPFRVAAVEDAMRTGVALALADHGQLPAPPVPTRWDSLLLLS
ncbi:MAG: hypothetical protein GEU83_21065 [Pseudonocardiaceae bacterium]|nr:hypothetical protein [Pseudonocardiaceae bacterium]